jgi:hypothetical protein
MNNSGILNQLSKVQAYYNAVNTYAKEHGKLVGNHVNRVRGLYTPTLVYNNAFFKNKFGQPNTNQPARTNSGLSRAHKEGAGSTRSATRPSEFAAGQGIRPMLYTPEQHQQLATRKSNFQRSLQEVKYLHDLPNFPNEFLSFKNLKKNYNEKKTKLELLRQKILNSISSSETPVNLGPYKKDPLVRQAVAQRSEFLKQRNRYLEKPGRNAPRHLLKDPKVLAAVVATKTKNAVASMERSLSGQPIIKKKVPRRVVRQRGAQRLLNAQLKKIIGG